MAHGTQFDALWQHASGIMKLSTPCVLAVNRFFYSISTHIIR